MSIGVLTFGLFEFKRKKNTKIIQFKRPKTKQRDLPKNMCECKDSQEKKVSRQ